MCTCKIKRCKCSLQRFSDHVHFCGLKALVEYLIELDFSLLLFFPLTTKIILLYYITVFIYRFVTFLA